MGTDEQRQRVREAVDALSEHFDAVEILVTWNEDKTTRSVIDGAGNYYARIALCQEFIEMDKARTWEHATKDES